MICRANYPGMNALISYLADECWADATSVPTVARNGYRHRQGVIGDGKRKSSAGSISPPVLRYREPESRPKDSRQGKRSLQRFGQCRSPCLAPWRRGRRPALAHRSTRLRPSGPGCRNQQASSMRTSFPAGSSSASTWSMSSRLASICTGCHRSPETIST